MGHAGELGFALSTGLTSTIDNDAKVSGLTVSQTRTNLAAFPGFVLRRAANAMMRDLSARLAPLDLTISEASIVLLVGARDDMTSADIGKELDIQRANMVRLLNRLESAGLIRREPIDRKSQAIVLTEKGTDTFRQIEAVTSRFESDLLSRVPEEHRAHLLPALHALTG